MSHTIFNLREAEDVAAKHGFGDSQEARFPWRDLDSETTGVALLSIKPGQRQPFAHHHDQAEEICVVLSGSGLVKLGDETHDLKPMDAVRIAPCAVGRPVARGGARRPRGAGLRPASRGRRRGRRGLLGRLS